MVGNILLAEPNQPQIPHHVDIRFGRVQRDQFRSLANTKSRSINPGGLTPDVVDRGESVEKDLSHNH